MYDIAVQMTHRVAYGLAGVGCLAVTFTVGGLSAINAVAAAYAEDLPVICITGVSNLWCAHAVP